MRPVQIRQKRFYLNEVKLQINEVKSRHLAVIIITSKTEENDIYWVNICSTSACGVPESPLSTLSIIFLDGEDYPYISCQQNFPKN